MEKIIWLIPKKNKYKDTSGLYIPVNLSLLVDKIYVAPSAPVWIKNLVHSVSVKYGLDKEVVQSDLASRPPY